MSPQLALHIVTWVAIVVLFLGLGAVLREVRFLRDRVGAAAATGGLTSLRLPPSLTGGHRRIVVAVDSGCPLCLGVVDRLATLAEGAPTRPVLLTYEPTEQWAAVAGRLDVVRDDQAWSTVAHLSTPILMLVDGAGVVERLVLPTHERDVNQSLESWGVQPAPEGRGLTNAA